MPVTINGDGSITGLAVGGLPDGSVDADTLASSAVTTAKIATNATYACARYIYRESGSGTTISSTGMGTQCPISDVIQQKNITNDWVASAHRHPHFPEKVQSLNGGADIR